MHGSDKEIINLCKKNKKEGYNLLYRNYERYIYTVCYQYTYSWEDALDLVQEVFIKIYKAMDTFDESRPLLPWIKRITANTCMNFNRDRDRQGVPVSLNRDIDDEENTLESLLPGDENVERDVICSDTRKALMESIKELPGEMKMAVILRHMHDMSYDEISKTMSSPVGSIKNYLHRGRGLLKEKLKKLGVWEV